MSTSSSDATPVSPAHPERWDGADATLAVMPTAGAASTASAAAAEAQGRWNGGEATLLILPSPQTASPAALEAKGERWDGGEATLAAMPTATPGPGQRTPRVIATMTEGPTPVPAARGPGADAWHLSGRPGELSGQVFGDYEIGSILGEGGMGTVYRAWQRSLGRRVAVKTLAQAYSLDPVQRSRFETEARAASLIQSPHVVAVYAAGSHNDSAYFVMEFVEGTDLAKRLAASEGRGLDPQVATDLVLQAARGLAVAGRQGVIHRDIKPGNILIGRDDVAKIADFGISKVAGEGNLTRTGTAVGTPSYVSPEQGRGETCDARSDLYSLGVVYYEALTGAKPFQGDNAEAIIYQHNYAEPRLPRTINEAIPEACQAVVVRCLQKDPSRRYQSADELIQDLERIRTGNLSITKIMEARHGTGADEAMRRRLGRRRAWMLPLAAALVLAAGTVGGLWWWQAQAEARAAVRRQEELVRARLREALDSAHPVAESARADLALLTRLAGEDADVRRWHGKVEQVQLLRTRLDRLDAAGLPELQLRQEARADLLAFAALTGEDGSELARWRSRLLETEQQIARLRSQLTVCDGEAEPTVADRERWRPQLDELRRLAGAEDPEAARWGRRLAGVDQHLERLRRPLAILDRTDAAPDEGEQARLAGLLDELARVRGQAAMDADEQRWRERLAGHRARLAALRASLGRLDGEQALGETLVARTTPELAAYRHLVPPDDAGLLRWDARLVEAAQRNSDLRARCTRLEHASELPLEGLLDGQQALAALRPLAPPQDDALPRWSRALTDALLRIDAWKAELLVLDRPEPVAATMHPRCRTALAELQRRAALREDAALAASRRLAEEERRLAELRQRLQEAERTRALASRALADDTMLYGRIAGEQDADYLRWRGRIVDFLALRERLAPLDQAVPLPEGADGAIAAFARFVGEEDAQVLAWRSKMSRVRSLQASLSVLDRAAEMPVEAASAITELRALVGEFPQAPAWLAKIARVRALEAACAVELGDETFVLGPDAAAHLAALEAETGVSERTRALARRLQLLSGPGRPAWAASYEIDAHGPLAMLVLDGPDTPVAIPFRWLPPGVGLVGSPTTERGRDSDEGQVRMRRSRGVWMAAHETSQAAWSLVMGGQPSFHLGPDLPVERVDWDEVHRFLERLHALRADVAARLPTEVEWEHACRAGRAQEPDIDRTAWWHGNAAGISHPCARLPANPLGIHDLLGNVSEWCEDRYGAYPAEEILDHLGIERDERIARGGAWNDPRERVRAANRVACPPGMRSPYLGFRLVIPQQAAP